MQLKVVVAGPKAVGKTAISNFISGNAEAISTDRYDPTSGVRVLEFEKRFNGIQEPLSIELWDSSGDQNYEGCWKAIMNDAAAVILVYNPDAPSQDQQIGDWFDFFVRKNGLKDEQCIVLAHRSKPSNDRFKPPPLFSRVSAAVTTNQSGPDIQNMVENLLRDVYQLKSRK